MRRLPPSSADLMLRQLDQMIDGYQSLRRDMARLSVDSHVLKLKTFRALTNALRGGPPGPEGSSTKLHWSESHQKLLSIATEILGERALSGPEPDSRDKASAGWVRDFLWTRAETILAGVMALAYDAGTSGMAASP